MSDGYVPYVTKTALDSMPLTVPGEEISKTFTGSDSVANVSSGMKTEPQANFSETPTGLLDWLDKNNLLVIGKENVARKKAEFAGKTDPGSFASLKPYLYAALFVVIGLLIISRGLGLIGSDDAEVFLGIDNPEKFPGFGHAIRSMKGKAK